MESLLNKEMLRTTLKQRRAAVLSARREEAREALLLQLLPTLAHAENVLSFVSFAHEIDTSSINLYLARTGRLLLPKVSGDCLKIFRVSNPQKQLIPNSFGLIEPDPQCCSELDANLLDIALVPALGFDKDNHRLGYGRGFYDRFLKQFPHIQTVGIGFKEQLIPFIPTQEHDVPLEKVSLF